MVVTLLALATFGLAAVAVTSTVLLRGYLTDRIDDQLVGFGRVVSAGPRSLPPPGSRAQQILPTDFQITLFDTDDRSETGRLGGALNLMLTRLAQALREKEQSASTLRRFIADASHELRTPITSIRGFAELFRRGGLDRPPEVSAAMRRIEDEATRMGLLVDDLLRLAHLDAHRPISREPVDLITLAHDAVLDARARDPGRTITLEIGDGPTFVVGDESRLCQVLANLLVNALIHTPTGTAIRVALAVLRPDHRVPTAVSGSGSGCMAADVVGLEVSDTGRGMTQAQASQIFDRFYRADTARARATGGSGLGLSIAASIVDAHGGRIEVYTAPGEGATFRVELPAHQFEERG